MCEKWYLVMQFVMVFLQGSQLGYIYSKWWIFVDKEVKHIRVIVRCYASLWKNISIQKRWLLNELGPLAVTTEVNIISAIKMIKYVVFNDQI